MQVVIAQPSHLNSTMQSIQACTSKLCSIGIDQWDEEYPSHEIVSEAVENQTLYLIEKDGLVAGAVGLDCNQPNEYQSCSWSYAAPSMVVHHLFVRPSFWRQGLAAELMSFAENHAKTLNVGSIRLDAYKENPAALSLYRNRGYSEAGEVTFPRRGLSFVVFERQVQ